MHELGITREIVDIAKEQCVKNNIAAETVTVELGDMASYKSDPLVYYYEILKIKHDELKESSLIVKNVKGTDLRVVQIKGD